MQTNRYTVIVTVEAQDAESACENVIKFLNMGCTPDEVRKLISVDGRTYEDVTKEVSQ